MNKNQLFNDRGHYIEANGEFFRLLIYILINICAFLFTSQIYRINNDEWKKKN